MFCSELFNQSNADCYFEPMTGCVHIYLHVCISVSVKRALLVYSCLLQCKPTLDGKRQASKSLQKSILLGKKLKIMNGKHFRFIKEKKACSFLTFSFIYISSLSQQSIVFFSILLVYLYTLLFLYIGFHLHDYFL